MISPLVFISLAFILYTFSIFYERKIGHLEIWLVVVFTLGFLCDLVGTSLMFCLAQVKFRLVLHSIAGYTALLIMFCHLVWAMLAIRKIKNFQYLFTRFSIYALGIWLLAFVSGIPKVSLLILSWLS